MVSERFHTSFIPYATFCGIEIKIQNTILKVVTKNFEFGMGNMYLNICHNILSGSDHNFDFIFDSCACNVCMQGNGTVHFGNKK